MRISVINKKGGVGKTSLSFSLAKDLEMFLLSNDDSTIELVYKDKAKIMKTPKIIDNAVYDFGGFVDVGVLEILDVSDIIIVPLTADLNSFKKTVSLLKEIQKENVILIANKSEKNDFQTIKEYFEKNYKFPIFEIKSSRIWKKTFETKQSVSEIKNESKVSKYIYRNSINGYENLLNYIKKEMK